MATPSRIPGNMTTNERGFTPVVGSAATLVFATDLSKPTAISIESNGSEFRCDTTTDAKKPDGTKLTDMEDSDVIWQTVSQSGIANYFAGGEDSKLISGVRIQGFSLSAASAVQHSITQQG